MREVEEKLAENELKIQQGETILANAVKAIELRANKHNTYID